MTRRCVVSAILVCVGCCGACQAVQALPGTPAQAVGPGLTDNLNLRGPTFSTSYEYAVDVLNAAEDVTYQVFVASDGVSGRMLQRVSANDSATGNASYFAQLIRNDLNTIYLYFRSDDPTAHVGTWCTAITGQIPMGAFSLAPFSFLRPRTWAGVDVSQWRFAYGEYLIGAMTDAASGAPVLMHSSQAMEQVMNYRYFVNGTVPPASTFAVPAACAEAATRSTEVLPTTHGEANTGSGADDVVAQAAAESLVFERAACDTEAAGTLPQLLDAHNARERTGARRGYTLGMTARGFHHWASGTGCVSSNLRKRVMSAADVAVAQRAQRAHLRTYIAGDRNAAPASVDMRPYAPPVRDQGQCGGCWSFASAAAVEVVANVAAGARSNASFTEWMAPQYLLDCVGPSANFTTVPILTKGCMGGWPMTALLNINATGIPKETLYPFASANGGCSAVSAASTPLRDVQAIAPGDVTSLKSAIAQYGAVTAIIQVLGDFEFYSAGVYNNPACGPNVLSHAVTIVGYGTDTVSGLDYWLVKNSFGRAWGEGGYFRMRRGVNMCGIEDWGIVPVPA